MPLSPTWWANTPTSPLRDNTDGAITAQTLRDLTLDIALTGIAVDWLQYVSGTPNMGSPYSWTVASEAETLYLQGGGTGKATANWTTLVNSNGQQVLAYNAGLEVLLTPSTSKTQVTVSGATAGTTIELVLWVGSGLTPNDTAARVISSPRVLTAGTNVVDIISSSPSIPLPSTAASLMLGFRLRPPAGQPIQSGTLNIDLDDFEVVLVARPSAPATAL